MKNVPKISDLKKIEDKPNVTPTEFSIKNDEPDPFKNLIPKEVAKKTNELRTLFFDEEKRVFDRCQEQTDSGFAILASLGLPVASTSSSEKGVPQSVWDTILETQKIGGIDELNRLYGRIEVSNTEAWQILQTDIISKLDEELRIDSEIRKKNMENNGNVQIQHHCKKNIEAKLPVPLDI